MSRLSNILVVEDDPDISLIIRMAIEHSSASEGGVTLNICPSTEQALAYLKEHKPQLMLLDQMLPGLSGIEFLKKVRKQGETAPAIFITAKTNVLHTCDFEPAGVLGIITKPFDPLTLWERIKGMYGVGIK
jgi:DNA-binding response OmpR family regulator